ncbi:hypothetical protein A6283_26585 [Bacillus wiedmannii]|uniref:hypothetical protein n=1 Tax=Bacillus wiedmannii TaxID=1890302 RepID=UPI0007DB2980|nr:hypothetical protein [Bacillus wiedmannii]OAK23558.1 hypothetical protein A6283_26585 [Bacillus wiedmannii]PHB67914.1 hypothetical protein COE89_26710 [Bacillus wiedmannii]
MNISFRFDTYHVSELNYQVKEIEVQGEEQEESVEVKNQFKVGIKKDFKEAFVEMDTDVSTKIKEEEFRMLTIRARFYFDVNAEFDQDTQSNKEKAKLIMDKLKIHGPLICETHMKEIIKNLTSSGYITPIMIENDLRF